MRWMLILVVLVSACGTDPGSGDGSSPGPTSEPPPTDAASESITGELGGDAQLEGGCAWVDDGATRWEIAWPAGYAVTFDPVTLTGPDGVTATEGHTITVHGSEVRDAVTTCQVGPLWQATNVVVEAG